MKISAHYRRRTWSFFYYIFVRNTWYFCQKYNRIRLNTSLALRRYSFLFIPFNTISIIWMIFLFFAYFPGFHWYFGIVRYPWVGIRMMSQTADCLPNRDRAGAAIGRFPSAERREPKGDRELGADWSTLFTSETTAKEGWTEGKCELGGIICKRL